MTRREGAALVTISAKCSRSRMEGFLESSLISDEITLSGTRCYESTLVVLITTTTSSVSILTCVWPAQSGVSVSESRLFQLLKDHATQTNRTMKNEEKLLQGIRDLRACSQGISINPQPSVLSRLQYFLKWSVADSGGNFCNYPTPDDSLISGYARSACVLDSLSRPSCRTDTAFSL